MTPAPVPVADAPAPVAANSPVAIPSAPVQTPPAPAPTPTQAAAAHDTVVRRDSASQDTLRREAAFLDSLHTMRADTTHPAIQVPVAPEAVRREAATLLGRPTWDIDVETYASHERVQYWMTYFTGRSRWHFERYIERAGRYDSMIRARLSAAGLPQDLIYLAMIESGFNPKAKSPAKAGGL